MTTSSSCDTILCNKHYTALIRLLKKRKLPEEEKEDHVVEIASSLEVAESQEDLPTQTLAVTRQEALSPKKRGRKLKYPADVRFRLAYYGQHLQQHRRWEAFTGS
jgi:hypothetical protein